MIIALVLGSISEPGNPSNVVDPERRFADIGFTAQPTDSLRPNQIFRGRIVSEIEESLEVSCILWGTDTNFGFSAIDLDNADGDLDIMREVPMRGRSIEIRSGEADQDWSAWNIEYVGQAQEVKPKERRRLQLLLASRSSAFDRTVNPDLFTSGNTAIIGKQRPVTLGEALNVPAFLTNPFAKTYDVGTNGGSGTVNLVRDNGNELTIAQWTDSGNGFVLNQQPEGRITADVTGPNTGGNDLETKTLSGFIEWVLDRSDFNINDVHSSVSALEIASPATLAYFADSPVTAAKMLKDLMDSYIGWYYVDRLGKFRVGRLSEPSSTPILSVLPTHFLIDEEIQGDADTMPGYTNVVAGMRNWHVNSSSEIANVLLSPVVQQIALDLQNDYRVRKTRTAAPPANNTGDDNIKKGAKVNTEGSGIGTLLQDPGQIQNLANRLATFIASRRNFHVLPLTWRPEFAALEPGDTIQVTAPSAKPGGPPRYGLNAKNLLVIGRTTRPRQSKLFIKCWG